MKTGIGEMAWLDISCQNASQVKDFYQSVVGWTSSGVSMGDYEDFAMIADNGDAVAGICHAKGCNIDLPPTWLPYFLVADIEQATAQVVEQGGKMTTEIKSMGDDKYAVIQDPAGAYCALYQKAKGSD